MTPLEDQKSNKKSKKKKSKPSKALDVTKEEFLRLRPIKSPFVLIKKQTSEEILIELDISEFKKRKLLNKFVPTPNYKKIQLDKLGKTVFLLCDGEHRIKDIIKIFQGEYRLTRTETELSVRKYLMMLTDRHLIGFMIPKDIVKNRNLSIDTIEKVIID
ncbi:MAG: PqqD family protein [Candidatus Hodarchaeales archaeon]|jgi:hypothetical protein